MSDHFASHSIALCDPAARARAVSPCDSADLPDSTRALYVGQTGDVVLTTVGGDTVTLLAVPVGVLAIRIKRIWSTGTSASNLVALW